jgi:tRNA (mo5U34)-methyltransferase
MRLLTILSVVRLYCSPRRRNLSELLAAGARAGKAGDWASAAASYADALAIDRETSRSQKGLMTAKHRAEICVQLGHALRLQEFPVAAETAYRESIALDGSNVFAHLCLALTLKTQDRIVEAAACFFNALKLVKKAEIREQMKAKIRDELRELDYSDREIGEALVKGSIPPTPAPPADPDFPLQQIDDLEAKVKSYCWHHSINLGGGIVTKGVKSRYVIEREAEIVFGPLDLPGRSVVDIGAWNGAFSVEAKRRSAGRVLALDEYTWTHPELRGRETFDLVMSRFGLEVESRTLDIREATVDTLGRWDFVLFLGVFYHLLNPIAVLQQLAAIANVALVLETHLDLHDVDRPAMVFYPGSELDGDATNWWAPNRTCMEKLLATVGFPTVHFTPHPSGPNRGFFHAYKP